MISFLKLNWGVSFLRFASFLSINLYHPFSNALISIGKCHYFLFLSIRLFWMFVFHKQTIENFLFVSRCIGKRMALASISMCLLATSSYSYFFNGFVLLRFVDKFSLLLPFIATIRWSFAITTHHHHYICLSLIHALSPSHCFAWCVLFWLHVGLMIHINRRFMVYCRFKMMLSLRH